MNQRWKRKNTITRAVPGEELDGRAARQRHHRPPQSTDHDGPGIPNAAVGDKADSRRRAAGPVRSAPDVGPRSPDMAGIVVVDYDPTWATTFESPALTNLAVYPRRIKTRR